MQYMADRVRELSGGSLEIGIYPSGMIGSEAECLKQVQNGQIDLAKTSSAVLESSVPEMVALGMPYLSGTTTTTGKCCSVRSAGNSGNCRRECGR